MNEPAAFRSKPSAARKTEQSLAVFLSHRMGTDPGYAKAERDLGLLHSGARHPLSESTKRHNLTLLKVRASNSATQRAPKIRVTETSGGIPVIYNSDKTNGWIKIKCYCMVAIREERDEDAGADQPQSVVFPLKTAKWPFYYCVSDFHRYNQRTYTRSFFQRRRDRKRRLPG